MSATGVLIVESSTPHASIARVNGDGTIVQRGFSSDRHHNTMVFGALTELLAEEMDPIGLVLVGSGPGSYSGTRVGIAAAQGVAIALQCPAVAMPSILAVPSAEHGAACLAVGDARRHSYWTSLMRDSGLVNDPGLCDAATLSRSIRDAIADGIPIVSLEDPSRFEIEPADRDAIRVEFPDASRLWNAWFASPEHAREQWRANIPQPIYLKPPHITQGKRPNLIS